MCEVKGSEEGKRNKKCIALEEGTHLAQVRVGLQSEKVARDRNEREVAHVADEPRDGGGDDARAASGRPRAAHAHEANRREQTSGAHATQRAVTGAEKPESRRQLVHGREPRAPRRREPLH